MPLTMIKSEAKYLPTALFPKDFSWPRISMVTSVYNGERYLEATICSILQQGYPNLEYIMIDDGSTDKSPEIIEKYKRYLSFHKRNESRQGGLFASLNEGFAKSTGPIMGWLNASDMLHLNSLFVVGSIFAEFPEVEWITGRPTILSPSGMTIMIDKVPRWSRYPVLAGLPSDQRIQQESTFWRRSLWRKAGGFLDSSYRAEGDFDLWIRFFRHSRLYSVDALIGAYRRHGEALSSDNMESYDQTCANIVERELNLIPRGTAIKYFRRIGVRLREVPGLRSLWYRIGVKAIISGRRHPVIRYDGDKWVVEERVMRQD
jgi:glycosyltransferase involved in cell wall biosynthesis